MSQLYHPVSVTVMACFILQDHTIAVWDMRSPTDIQLKRVILDGTLDVYAVELDHNYIYGADYGDIKVHSCKFP